MQSPIYIFSLVAAVCGLWLLWVFGLRPLFLDMFRERIFELRFSLFRLGMSGELPFDSDAYRSVEMLMCGLLRFGHRITLFTYVLSIIEETRAARQDRDYTDASQRIALKVSQLAPKTQSKVDSILNGARTAAVVYIASTSLILLVVTPIVLIARCLGIWRPSKSTISRPIEREAYRAELHHPLRPVVA